MRKKGFTLIELLVVVAIIAMLLSILMPALSRVKKIAQRVVCGTNLKGLGTSMQVYSQDFGDDFPVANCLSSDDPPLNRWATNTSGWSNPTVSSFDTATVGASLYLLVKYADTNPKQFVCPASDQLPYAGENTGYDDDPTGSTAALDIVELNDFGQYTDRKTKKPDNGESNRHGAKMHVSFSYHNPYTRFRATGNKSAQFAVMADKNPWMDSKLTPAAALKEVDADTYIDLVSIITEWWAYNLPREQRLSANSQPHDREGQNVMYGDGHNEYAKTADVGVKFDNIYTYQETPSPDSDIPHRRGRAGDSIVSDGDDYVPQAINPKNRNEPMCPRTSWDSFLVNDDVNASKDYL